MIFFRFLVKETIIKCEFNTESALNTLLNSPMSGGSNEKTVKKSSKMKPKSTRSSPPPSENLERLGPNIKKPLVLWSSFSTNDTPSFHKFS